MKRLLMLLAALTFVLPIPTAQATGPVVGATCTFTWTEPQTNSDGTNLADLKEYRLLISQTSGAYGVVAAKIIPAPLADPAAGSVLTSACPSGIPQGQNFAVMIAVDLGGNTSVFSNEAPFVFDTVAPGAPIQLVPK